jgi:hypothetical protein
MIAIETPDVEAVDEAILAMETSMPIDALDMDDEDDEHIVEMDWLADHAEIWEQYQEQWIAIAGEQIVAAGDDLLTVWHSAKQKADNPLFFLVPPEPPLIL